MRPKCYFFSVFWGFFLCLSANFVRAQDPDYTPTQMLPHIDSIEYLLTNQTIQIECTSGVNDLYNFKFGRAESQFHWLRKTYPAHPLPYFLLGLSEWWKMVPNIDVEKYDARFLAYMDSSIHFAELLFAEDNENVEASFFLAAAYGFKGRVYSERKNWAKAALSGKRALKYMEYCRKKNDLSPELLFGDGLYNYYSVWIPENYPVLRPILWFFDKGDKALGLRQLEKVAREAFYTRVEAQYFLMRIFATDEERPEDALRIAKYLHNTYPDNAYFHRFYARMRYQLGDYAELEESSKSILARIEAKMPGYEAVSGRYAGFFLGAVYKLLYGNVEKAEECYKKTVAFAEESQSTESGYYLYALKYLGDFAKERGDYVTANGYYQKILKYTNKKHALRKDAKRFKEDYKKWKKKRS